MLAGRVALSFTIRDTDLVLGDIQTGNSECPQWVESGHGATGSSTVRFGVSTRIARASGTGRA